MDDLTPKRAFLIGYDIWESAWEGERAIIDDYWRKITKESNNRFGFILPTTSKSLASYRNVRESVLNVPKYWDDKIKGKYLSYPFPNLGYTTWLAIIQIEPNQVSTVLADIKEKTVDCDDLFSSMFYKDVPWRINKKHSYFTYFPTLFYIEYENYNERNLNETENHIEVNAKKVCNFLSVGPSLSLPIYTLGYLAIHGNRTIDPQNDLILVDLAPAEIISDNILIVPEMVNSFIEYSVAIHIFKHIVNKLKQLDLSKMPASEYFNELTNNKELLEIYELEYLNLRREIENALVESKRTIEDHNNYVKNRWPNTIIESKTFKPINCNTPGETQNELSYNMIDMLASIYTGSLKKAKELIALVEVREKTLTTYMQDTVSFHTAKSNIQLQREIKKLSKVAIYFALLFTFIGLYSSEIKIALNALVEWVINCITFLYLSNI